MRLFLVKRVFATAITAMLLSVSGVAVAAPLTLDDCIKLSLEKSQDVNLINSDLYKARLQHENSIAGRGPILSNWGSANITQDKTTLSGGVGLSLQLGQNFGPTGLLGNNQSINKAKSDVYWDNAQIEASKAMDNLSSKVIGYYFGVIKSRQNLEIAKKKTERLVAVALPDAKARLAAGLIVEADVLSVQAAIEAARLDEKRAENSLKSMESFLIQMIGTTDITELDPSNPDVKLIAELLSLPSDQLTELALKQRPDLKKIQNDLQLASLSFEQSKLQARPNIGFGINYNLAAEKDGAATSISLGTNRDEGRYNYKAGMSTSLNLQKADADRDASWNAAIDFSIPGLLDGGVLKRNLTMARMDYDAALRSAEASKSAIKDDVAAAAFALYDANSRWEQSKYSVNLAEAYLKAAKAKYEAGVITRTELSDAEFNVYTSQIYSQQAGFDVLIATDKLQKVLGTN